MKLSFFSRTATATLLLAITGFVPSMSGRAESTGVVQKVNDQQAPMDAAKTGVGSPASKAGPTTGAGPTKAEMGSQQSSANRASKTGASDNPAEPINPAHPSPSQAK